MRGIRTTPHYADVDDGEDGNCLVITPLRTERRTLSPFVNINETVEPQIMPQQPYYYPQYQPRRSQSGGSTHDDAPKLTTPHAGMSLDSYPLRLDDDLIISRSASCHSNPYRHAMHSSGGPPLWWGGGGEVPDGPPLAPPPFPGEGAPPSYHPQHYTAATSPTGSPRNRPPLFPQNTNTSASCPKEQDVQQGTSSRQLGGSDDDAPPAVAEGEVKDGTLVAGSAADDTRCCSGSSRLGPLIVVKGRRRGVAQSDPVDPPEGWALVSKAESQSYKNEVLSLHSQLEAAVERASKAERETKRAAEELSEDMVRQYKDEERLRRQQMQDVLDKLREENTALIAKLEVSKWARAADGGCGAVVAADGTKSEWTARIHEVESYWRERLRAAESHWSAEVHTQSKDKGEMQRLLQEATRTSQELQESLRHTLSERESLKAENARLAAQVHTHQQAAGGKGDQAALRVQLRDCERRNEALLAQVDSYGEENTRMQVQYTRELQQARQELEKERARSAELVKLYSGQIQSLHAQLRDARR